MTDALMDDRNTVFMFKGILLFEAVDRGRYASRQVAQSEACQEDQG